MWQIEEIKNYMKKEKITYNDLAKKSNLSLSCITKIFSGHAKYPRVDTMETIIKTLNLPPEWTEEDRAQGVGKHAVVLSDEDERRLQLLWHAEETLGSDYVKAYLYALEIAIQQKQLK